MARIRSLKPEFWDDRKLARSVSRDARMLYVGLWNQADEHSRLNGDVFWIKGRVFPYDDDILTDDVDHMLSELSGGGWVQRYEANGDPFLFLPKLGKHQRLEPSKAASKIPGPPDVNPEPAQTSPRKSARDSHSSEPDADSSALLYVAGSMEHVGAESPAQTKSRPRDELWDSIVEVCGIESSSLTKSATGEIANAKKQLTEVSATPVQVRARAGRYRQRYRDTALTPSALAKHWASLGDAAPPASMRPIDPMTALSQAARDRA